MRPRDSPQAGSDGRAGRFSWLSALRRSCNSDQDWPGDQNAAIYAHVTAGCAGDAELEGM